MGMDVWKATKKAINSNISKPLNTLIDERINDAIEEMRKRQILGAINVVSNTHTPGQTITALDISGSGVLYFAFVYGYMKSNGITSASIQVIVDDETILNAKLISTSTTNPYNRLVGLADMMSLVLQDDKYYYIPTTKGGKMLSSDISPWSLNLSPDLQTLSGYSDDGIVFLKNGLRFNRNLKVIVTSEGSAGTTSEIVASSIGYILD